MTVYTATGTSIGGPDFSPDGSTIAFNQLNNGVWDIWTVPTAGGSATNLTQNGAGSSSLEPAFSPDGTEIAFTRVDNSLYATTIDVMSSSGGSETALVTPSSGTSVSSPDWAVETQSSPPPHHKKHHKHHKKH